jgi:hypothetical protein
MEVFRRRAVRRMESTVTITREGARMPVSTAADTAMQQLTAKWYSAVCTACNLDPSTFQLVQGALPVPMNASGTTYLWQILNSIPPQAVNQFYADSQGNLFSQNYAAVINSLAPPTEAAAFQNDLGPSLKAWNKYLLGHMPNPLTPASVCNLFEGWAMANLTPSVTQKALTDLREWQLDEVGQAQQMLLALSGGMNGKNANVAAFTVTIDDVRTQLASAPSRSVSMESQSQSDQTSNSWAQGSVSGGYDFFYGSGNTQYDSYTSALSNAGISITATFQKLATITAGPLAESESTDPILSQYVPWYNSAAFGVAFNDPSAWNSNSQTTWADTFGPSGNLLRIASDIVVVDGIDFRVTSNIGLANASQQNFQAAAQGGFFPFFSASASGGWSTTTTFDDSGAVTIISKCPSGNPNILGVHVTPIASYLGAS